MRRVRGRACPRRGLGEGLARECSSMSSLPFSCRRAAVEVGEHGEDVAERREVGDEAVGGVADEVVGTEELPERVAETR